MHVNGTAIPSTYVNFTIVELNTVSLQVNVCAQGPIGQIWHLCQGPLEIGVTAACHFIHLPRPSSRSQWSLQERIVILSCSNINCLNLRGMVMEFYRVCQATSVCPACPGGKNNFGSFHNLTMSNHSPSGNMIDPAIHSPRRNHTFVGSNQVLQA